MKQALDAVPVDHLDRPCSVGRLDRPGEEVRINVGEERLVNPLGASHVPGRKAVDCCDGDATNHRTLKKPASACPNHPAPPKSPYRSQRVLRLRFQSVKHKGL